MPSSSSGSLILPIVLWDNIPPECHISSLMVSESEKYIFTGTTSGHLIMWDFNLDDAEKITPVCLMIGHTSVVNCLARGGHYKDDEYIVSSSENGEMKLWEINEKKCIENIKMANTVHKNIYSSNVNGKQTRLFCIGNYTDVLVMDPMSLDILYTLISREHHEWVKALCINSLANKMDDVIVGVSVTGTIKLWTVNANEIKEICKGAEIVEHEFKHCSCEDANTLASCPGKQRIFIVVCPKFFQIFDAFDFTVLCQVNVSSLLKTQKTDSNEDASIVFKSGFFLDIENLIVCTSDGYAYLYSLPDNINPQSGMFRQKLGQTQDENSPTARLMCKFTLSPMNEEKPNKLMNSYYQSTFYMYETRKRSGTSQSTAQPNPMYPSLKYLLRGDCHGRIGLWNLNNSSLSSIASDGNKPANYELSLKRFWKENVTQDSEKLGSISTFLYLPIIDKIVYGMLDGSILIQPAIDFLIKNLFRRNVSTDRQNCIKLKKHSAKVTCILYPHAESPRYDPTMLVTGSLDFSIVLWNINTGDMIHRFTVQTGEILQLSVPPNNVNPRILQCICSIASDHSVALLSLKECKPVMVASRHLFPVLFIKWRPLDDYLIVKCSDGGVFVWQIETGNLDRVAHGLLAEDILNAADEVYFETSSTAANPGPASAISNPASHTSSSVLPSNSSPMIISNKSISNQTVALSFILQKRNFPNVIKAISQKLATTKDDSKNPFRLGSSDSVKHLLLFDIDSLLTTLLLEEQSIDQMIKYIKNNFFKDAHGVMSSPPSQIPPLHRTNIENIHSSLKRNASAKLFDSVDIKQLNILKSKVNYAQSIIKLTHILLSSLHVWSIDQSLDQLFVDKLHLQKPKHPIAFGRISRGAHLFIMFPQRKSTYTLPASISANKPVVTVKNNTIPKPKSMNLITFDDSEDEKIKSPTTPIKTIPEDRIDESSVALLETPSPTKEAWLSNKTITTEHLLAILAISNSFMNLQNFIDLHIKKEDTDPIEFILGDFSSQTQLSEYHGSYSETQAVIKQTYSRLYTMYCMLSDYYCNDMTGLSFKSLNLETLALKWMDPSYEIREAAQALLKNELKRIGPNGRASLIKQWEPHLSNLLKDFEDLSQLNISQQSTQQSPIQQQLQSSSQNLYQLQNPQAIHSTSSFISVDLPTQASKQPHDLSNLAPHSNRIRRKQFVAIIILSLIGAEFGQDVNSNKNQLPYKTIPQGFSLEDHSILKRISTALSNLVTNKSLHHDITRRAAIDLIGRGFAIWEPFIQPTLVLLSLLELSADAELYVPRNDIWKSTQKDQQGLSINLPLTPIADTCRIARNSITLIANSKPKTFILTIAKEIKRINASNQANQNSGASYQFGQVLTKGKPEILQIIERLIDNQSQDVFELLSDVIEIILFCIDPNQLRSSNLEEIFPPLFKFPMVRYCKETKRIICGCHNGRLVMYEYKTSKWNFQSYPAHNGQAIIAVAISNDSKYVASFSAHDKTLICWQSSGGNIFNIGSSSLKQAKVYNAAPVELNVPCTRLAGLTWQNKILNLAYHDNRRFTYQI